LGREREGRQNPNRNFIDSRRDSIFSVCADRGEGGIEGKGQGGGGAWVGGGGEKREAGRKAFNKKLEWRMTLSDKER